MANIAPVSFTALHHCLTEDFGLLPEPPHGGSWRTYFSGAIIWHPASSTRLLKVILGADSVPLRILLCVSSDNNNSVFLSVPFLFAELQTAIANEQQKLAQRAAIQR
ncbi:hypothetical protein FHW67_001557 [Herbaspirillum sp. Sphag1AN]|nr:hypothetical protein [Herbaspirillum sp. Sphag1AN]MBB3245625.1 hypothetical protein [Herbaspirillum sp. Sphag64]